MYEIDTQIKQDDVAVKTCVTRGVYCDVDYTMLNATTENDSTRKYRSVVVDPENNVVLSFALPKSIPLETFKANHPDMSGVTATHIVEGTMVNLFYDTRTAMWEIATKGVVGGHNWFYRTQYECNKDLVPQLSFLDMFMDALGAAQDAELNDVLLFSTLDTSYSYSFVVQHTYNHMVLPIEVPAAYLVAVFHNVFNTVRAVPLENVENLFAGSLVKFPTKCDVSESVLKDWREMGVMLSHDESGDRTTVFNPNYVAMQDIRGNHPNLQYHYLELVKRYALCDFLIAFPTYRYLFEEFQRSKNRLINEIHSTYMRYFVKKQRINNIDKPIFCAIQKIHRVVHMPFGVVITRHVIERYFDTLDVKEQFHLSDYKAQMSRLNYDDMPDLIRHADIPPLMLNDTYDDMPDLVCCDDMPPLMLNDTYDDMPDLICYNDTQDLMYDDLPELLDDDTQEEEEAIRAPATDVDDELGDSELSMEELELKYGKLRFDECYGDFVDCDGFVRRVVHNRTNDAWARQMANDEIRRTPTNETNDE